MCLMVVCVLIYMLICLLAVHAKIDEDDLLLDNEFISTIYYKLKYATFTRILEIKIQWIHDKLMRCCQCCLVIFLTGYDWLYS